MGQALPGSYDDDPTFPWLPIVECVAETLPSGVVRRYSFVRVRRAIRAASAFPLLAPDLALSPAAAVAPRKRLRWSSQHGPWSKASTSADAAAAAAAASDVIPSLLPFAGALLRADARLRRLRYHCVPGRMSESWRKTSSVPWTSAIARAGRTKAYRGLIVTTVPT